MEHLGSAPLIQTLTLSGFMYALRLTSPVVGAAAAMQTTGPAGALFAVIQKVVRVLGVPSSWFFHNYEMVNTIGKP